MSERILITGASGFIGSFLCEEGLRRQMSVWAGIRRSSSRKWLQNEWLQMQILDLTDRDVLKQQLESFRKKYGKWDYVIHAAGATKCLRPEDFDRNNYDCTVNLVEALRDLDMVPRLFVYVSSLSVLGPIKEQLVEKKERKTLELRAQSFQQYEDLLPTDTPEPNTAYGHSKVRSEQYLSEQTDFPYVIFRPTGVYGPRERDYFLMAKSIKQHVDFAVGYKPQEITFVYVRDLVAAIYAAIDREQQGEVERVLHETFHVSDGEVYASRAFSDYIQQFLGVKHVLHVKAPLWFLRAVCGVSEFFSKLAKKTTTLNGDKYKIMSQRNWNCDITPLKERLDFEPQWKLERGTKETMEWYKKEGWL